MHLESIARVPLSEFQPPMLSGQPCVLFDDKDYWKTLRQWQPDYLKQAAGENEVYVRETHGAPQNIFQNLREGGRIPFADYLDWVLDAAGRLGNIARSERSPAEISRAIIETQIDHSYYLDANLGTLSQQLLREAPAPPWYNSSPLDINLWCGIVGTSSGLHFDVTPNCNLQVSGEKHFTLFSPSQSRFLYRVPGITHGSFDPNLPDFDRYPLAKEARGVACRLQPGECLYIPVGWFHQVTVVSAWALNVNFFWARPRLQTVQHPRIWPFLMRKTRAKLRMLRAPEAAQRTQ